MSASVACLVRDQHVAYYAALSEADQLAEATPFVEFMLQALSLALEEAVRNEPATDQVTDQVARLLGALLGGGPLKVNELMAALGLAHKATFRANYLKPALAVGLIEMTDPGSPRSPVQRYRLTEPGKQTAARFGSA